MFHSVLQLFTTIFLAVDRMAFIDSQFNKASLSQIKVCPRNVILPLKSHILCCSSYKQDSLYFYFQQYYLSIVSCTAR